MGSERERGEGGRGGGEGMKKKLDRKGIWTTWKKSGWGTDGGGKKG